MNFYPNPDEPALLSVLFRRVLHPVGNMIAILKRVF